MTSVAEAWEQIVELMPRRPVQKVPVDQSVDLILAETVTAERDLPPFDRVTMDGIAISSQAWQSGRRRFAITGIQAAGQPASHAVAEGACVRVMTGAVRPEGTDAVIPVERLKIDGDQAEVDDSVIVEAGRFIHPQGSDRRQGDTVLEPGIRIGPAEMAVLASSGYASVATTKPANIAVISTGDELVAVEAEEIAPHQIRSSNDHAIAAGLLRQRLANCTRTTLPDDAAVILDTTARLHEENDVLILSGGVSMGDFDYVPSVLEKLQARVVFHRILQKPGRPMWFGISGAGKPIFALPGNPVSTLLCMTRYVLPALRLSAGLNPAAPEFAALSEDASGPEDLTWFVPVTLSWSDDGVEIAQPRPTNTSGDFSSLAATDGFIELAPGNRLRPQGTIGRVFRW